MKKNRFLILSFLTCALSPVKAQISIFPYVENFDSVSAPAVPAGWSISGFIVNTATFRSPLNCIAATGNMAIKSITSPVFNLKNNIPDKLIFWERRSNTAAVYRFEVRASLGGGIFDSLLAQFDTISTTSGYVKREVNLKGFGLEYQPFVQFQWRLPGDGTNNTGVLRIDDVSLTITTGSDVGISQLVINPSNATRNDSLTISTKVKNYGSLIASDFSIRFYHDDNSDNIAQSQEQLFMLTGLKLNQGDSLICSVVRPPLKPGDHRFIAVVDLAKDENRLNDTVSTDVLIGCSKGSVLLNEIMYAPAGDEPEWVELYNASTDSINIKNWRISDNNVSTKSFISQTDYIISPNSYGVITKDNNFYVYHPDVPFLVANFAALNNTTSDAVVIYDSRVQTIDSILYAPAWGGQNGRSLERIDAQSVSSLNTNWGTSQDSNGSSPGRINSIARLDYDLAISNISQTQSMVNGKVVPAINVVICNNGKKSADSVFIKFFADSNNNNVPEPFELIDEIFLAESINTNDSAVVSYPCPGFSSGEKRVIVFAGCRADERLRNNQSYADIKTSYDVRSVVINEIMYDPINGQNEWLELFNRSNYPIDLANWTFNDRSTSSGVNRFKISDTNMIVPAGWFVVVSADSSIYKFISGHGSADSIYCLKILQQPGGFSLNNDGDIIVLKDFTGKSIDSISYSNRWHSPNVVDTRGRSLERISPNIDSNDPRNWNTCTNILGGTPGKQNSVYLANIMNSSRISISPNPFSPDGDGFEDFCIIHYNLPTVTSSLSIKIYDIKGRAIKTLANAEFAGHQGDIIWNGLDENGQRARIGVYIVYLEAVDLTAGRVSTAKTVIVVATRL